MISCQIYKQRVLKKVIYFCFFSRSIQSAPKVSGTLHFQDYSLIDLHAHLVFIQCSALLTIINYIHTEISHNSTVYKSFKIENQVNFLKTFFLQSWKNFDIPDSEHNFPTFWMTETLFSLADNQSFWKGSILGNISRFSSTISNIVVYKDSVDFLMKVIQSEDILLESSNEERLFKELKSSTFMVKGIQLLTNSIIPEQSYHTFGIREQSKSNSESVKLGVKFLEEASHDSSLSQRLSTFILAIYQFGFLPKLRPSFEYKTDLACKNITKLQHFIDYPKFESFSGLIFRYFYYLHSKKDLEKSHEKIERLAKLSKKVLTIPELELTSLYEQLWSKIYKLDFETASEFSAKLFLSVKSDKFYFAYLTSILKIRSIEIDQSGNEYVKKVKIENITNFLKEAAKKIEGSKIMSRKSPVARLAEKRLGLLLENPSSCLLLIVELIFWNDSFKTICGIFEYREKFREIINTDLKFKEVLKYEYFGCDILVLNFLIGTAFITAIPDYGKHDYMTEKSFGLLIYNLSHSNNTDNYILSTYLTFKLCHQVFSNTLNSKNLIYGSYNTPAESEYYSGHDYFYFTLLEYLQESKARGSISSKQTATEFDIKESMDLLLISVVRFKESIKNIKNQDAVYIGRVYYLVKNLEIEIQGDIFRTSLSKEEN